ncbi:hypothetical protein P5W99_31470 [Paraburkholderia sp. A3BS-1L]|uniref:hypothetical protein n=1 Tax=Paraburkholderia sp. A3BS-1L TaxID=3028375 RepID=UPI003DA85429
MNFEICSCRRAGDIGWCFMFVTSENNRLPPYALPFGEAEGATAWTAIEQLIPRDVLILRVSPVRSRVVPTIVMLDLSTTAPHLEQFVSGDVVLRGAAVLSTRFAHEVDRWTLDPLSEIRVGVTEPEKYSQGERLMTVTRFTTAAGRTFSVPYALATRPARGRRLWRAKAPATPARA